MKPVSNFSGMHIEVLEIAVVKLVAILRDEKEPIEDYKDYEREKKSLTMIERRYCGRYDHLDLFDQEEM